MTPRSLFNVILKVLGIFFIKDALIFLAQVFSQIFYKSSNDIRAENINFVNLISVILVFVVCVGIIYLLIFKTGFIIDTLKLDQGFNQDLIPLNLHRSLILSIAIIVIGGLILVDEIPNFINQLHFYFEEKNITYGNVGSKVVAYSILSASKIFIAFLLIIYQKQIVNFIEFKRKR